jgi:hypothetical protein
MSRGTETKSAVDVAKGCAPTQERDSQQDAGPGNAAIAAQLLGARPDECKPPIGPLEGNLVVALTNPDTSPCARSHHGRKPSQSVRAAAQQRLLGVLHLAVRNPLQGLHKGGRRPAGAPVAVHLGNERRRENSACVARSDSGSARAHTTAE